MLFIIIKPKRILLSVLVDAQVMSKTVLGIDLGTSSVKVSVVLVKPDGDFVVKYEAKCPYDQSRIRGNVSNVNQSQQSVLVIFESARDALKQVDFKSIELIAVCGQVHGCVLWNSETLVKDGQVNLSTTSDLYDWTDNRCSKEFIQSLPQPDCYADQVSSGYGCATLFWLSKNQPDYLRQFNKSGTIMDLFVTVICQLNDVSMSSHNAHSWAYFNPKTNKWNTQLLEKANFPVHLLPKPVPLNTVVGHTKPNGYFADLITENIPVVVPYGDLQSMMHLAFCKNPDTIVVNIGTSAQICQLMDCSFDPPRKSTSPVKTIDYDPFTSETYIAKAAGLNGGNVLREFSNFFRESIKQLTRIELSEKQFWNKLDELRRADNGSNENTFSITPRLWGERHEPESSFTLTGLRHKQPGLLGVTRNLFRGLLENLFDLRPDLSDLNKQVEFVYTGSVFAQNPLLQQILMETIEERVHLVAPNINSIDCFDADIGCALFAVDQLNQMY